MKDYKEILNKLRDFLEAAIEEGSNCGYNGPYDPKDKDQSQFDRGQYASYVKVYKLLLKSLSEEDVPNDDSKDDDDDPDDDPGCPLEEFLRQIADLANDAE